VFARLSGPEGLTSMHNTFARRHALAELAGAFTQGIPSDALERVTSSYLAEPDVHELDTVGADARYTTAGLLACEREIIGSADCRRADDVGVLAGEVVDRALQLHGLRLNPDQEAAVRSLTSSGHGIDVVEALAGTGKTTMIGAITDCYRLAGWQVIGTAPTGRAARQLRETAHIPAATMHALLAELGRAAGFRFRTVLVIDEAGMAPTRITSQILACADRANVKVIAVGDPGQLGSVQAGGWLAALTHRHPGPALREVVRQRDPRERAALEALHDGNPDPYLAVKRNAIAFHAGEAEAVDALVDQWDTAALEHGLPAAVMIARDNGTREQLNAAARVRLKQTHRLPITGVVIGGREFTLGDRVIARRNDRRLDVDNGTVATVVAADPINQRVTVSTDSGEVRELGADYVAAHLEHAYALTAHGTQGTTVTWAGVIGHPHEFTREWAYTALSRAREQTTLHVIAQPGRHGPRPPAVDRPGDRAPTEAMTALRRAMVEADSEPLALEHAPGLKHIRPSVARQAELDRLAEADLRRALRLTDGPAFPSLRRSWSQTTAPSPPRMTR
jgi:ATP-dependent exoDNAse (exonuclease V) alpha subunit